MEISFGSVDRVVVYGAEGMEFDLIWSRSPLAQFVERLLSVQMVRGFGPSYMKTISFVFLTSTNKCSLLSMRGSQSLYNTIQYNIFIPIGVPQGAITNIHS